MKFIRMILWKEFLHIKADPLMVRLITIPVLLQLFVIGYALTVEVKNIPILICDRSNTPQSREVVSLIRQSDRFVYKGSAHEHEAHALIYEGVAKIAILIPKDFTRSMESKSGGSIQIIADGQDANSSNVALGYCKAIISGWAKNRLAHKLEKAGMDIDRLIPVTVSTNILYNPMLKSTWYMIPALSVLLVTIVTALLTGLSIVRERESGTFEQLMVTPIKPIHIIFGKIIPFAIIGLLEITVVLIIATVWFKIPFQGNILVLFTFAIAYMISSLGIGIFISTITRTPQQVLFLTWFVLIFFILLSGFFVPVENMPHWVQSITYANPVRFFMFAVREIFLKGTGFEGLWEEFLILLSIGAFVFSLALLSFNRRAG
jgi:ABC-2 type transport system permease protein